MLKEVLSNLLRQGRRWFMISHRPSILKLADRVLRAPTAARCGLQVEAGTASRIPLKLKKRTHRMTVTAESVIRNRNPAVGGDADPVQLPGWRRRRRFRGYAHCVVPLLNASGMARRSPSCRGSGSPFHGQPRSRRSFGSVMANLNFPLQSGFERDGLKRLTSER